jgi:hypothetical protein
MDANVSGNGDTRPGGRVGLASPARQLGNYLSPHSWTSLILISVKAVMGFMTGLDGQDWMDIARRSRG